MCSRCCPHCLTMQRNDVYSITYLLGSFGWNSFIFELQNHFYVWKKKKKLSTCFHFLFFQHVGVVIMEHCGVADNCLVLSARTAHSGYKLFPLLPKSSPTARWGRHGPHSSLRSAEVISVNQILISRARFNQNIPVCGMNVGYNEALRNETDVGCG